MNANDPVCLLDRSKDKIFLWAHLPLPAPHHFVTAHPSAEMLLVEPIENCSQIKALSFMAKIQLPLHERLRVSQLAFGFFCHAVSSKVICVKGEQV
jgi:hypothetical protein